MTRVERFKAEHWNEIAEQEAMAYLRDYISPEMVQSLEKSKYAYTIRVDGRVVACVGVVEFWQGRGEAWTVIDRNCKREFISIHRTVKSLLKICPTDRVEAVVDLGFDAGHRWMDLLGFKLEAPIMAKYRQNGAHCSLYARVKNHG